MPKICVPIQAKTQKEAKALLKKAKSVGADIAELWLDQIEDLDLADLLAKKPLPVLCVCKKPAQKAELLLQAVRAGAEYLDIPTSTSESLFKKVREGAGKTKIILSYHDFKGTPSLETLLRKAEAMRARKPDILKIATTARDFEDTAHIIALAHTLQGQGVPHILIAMGKKGMLSRVLTPTLGGEMMFACLSAKTVTDEGQLTVRELKKQWQSL